MKYLSKSFTVPGLKAEDWERIFGNKKCEFDICDNCKFYISNGRLNICEKLGFGTLPCSTCSYFVCTICNKEEASDGKSDS